MSVFSTGVARDGPLWRGTKRRMESCDIHLRMPSRVLFLAPAIKAVSSTMQLKILRFGGSSVRMRLSSDRGLGGNVLRRILAAAAAAGVANGEGGGSSR